MNIDQIGKLAQQARREGRLDDARRHAREVISLCRRDDSNEHLVQALRFLGQIERDDGNHEAALPHYEEAVAECRKSGDSSTLAHTIRHLADLHTDLGNLVVAEQLYDETMAIHRGDPNTHPGNLANAVRAFAVLKDKAGKSDEGRPLWEEARGLYAKLGVEEGVAECDERLR